MKAIAKKLSEIAAECAYVQKSKRNTQQSYNYAPAAAVLEKVNDSFSKHGIATSTKTEVVNVDIAQTKSGGEMQRVIVKVTVTLIDSESGECLTVEGMGGGTDSGDKAVMKAQTAAIKYAYMIAFSMETGDDPEADVTTDEKTQNKPPQQRPQAVPNPKPTEPKPTTTQSSGDLVSAAQAKMLYSKANALGYTEDEVKNDMLLPFGKTSANELTKAEFQELMSHLKPKSA
jgi:ERF superfamily.